MALDFKNRSINSLNIRIIYYLNYNNLINLNFLRVNFNPIIDPHLPCIKFSEII